MFRIRQKDSHYYISEILINNPDNSVFVMDSKKYVKFSLRQARRTLFIHHKCWQHKVSRYKYKIEYVKEI
jgi:hypothetical protein